MLGTMNLHWWVPSFGTREHKIIGQVLVSAPGELAQYVADLLRSPYFIISHRHLMNSFERISPHPLSSTLKTSITGTLPLFRIRHTPPSSLIVPFSPIASPSASAYPLRAPEIASRRRGKGPAHTIQPPCREVDTNIPIPRPLPSPFHQARDFRRLQLLQGL